MVHVGAAEVDGCRDETRGEPPDYVNVNVRGGDPGTIRHEQEWRPAQKPPRRTAAGVWHHEGGTLGHVFDAKERRASEGRASER